MNHRIITCASLGPPTPFTTPNGISIQSAVFAGFTIVTNRQTDRPTDRPTDTAMRLTKCAAQPQRFVDVESNKSNDSCRFGNRSRNLKLNMLLVQFSATSGVPQVEHGEQVACNCFRHVAEMDGL